MLIIYLSHSKVQKVEEERNQVKSNKNHNSSLNHLPAPPDEEEQYEETNNYYHKENYRGNNRDRRPYRGQQGGSRKPYIGFQHRGRGQQNNYRGQYQGNHGQYNTSSGGYYNDNNYSNYQGRGGHGHGGNNYRGHGHGGGSY